MPNPGFWFKDDWPQILEENCYCLNPTNMTVNSTVTPLSFATLGTVRTSFLNILLNPTNITVNSTFTPLSLATLGTVRT